MKITHQNYWKPFEAVTEPIIILNKGFEIIWSNYAGLRHINLARSSDQSPLCDLWADKNIDCPIRSFFHETSDRQDTEGIASVPNYENVISPLRDEEGQTVAWYLTFKDIGRKKELESFVQTTFSRFKSIFEEFPSALLVFDSQLRIKYCNRKFYKLFGSDNQSILSRNLNQIDSLKSINNLIKNAQVLIDTEKRQHFLVDYFDKGRKKLEIDLFLVRTFSHEQKEYCLSIADKTDYHRLHRDATLLYRAVSESDYGFAILDDELNIIYSNPAFSNLLFVKDSTGCNLKYQFASSEGFWDSMLQSLSQYGGFHSEIDWETGAVSGIYDFSISEIHLHEHRFKGFIVTLNDISSQKRFENWLKESQKMDSLFELAYSFIHDFKNMLASIQGSADMIRRKNPVGVVKYLDIIDRTTKTAKDMLDNVVHVRSGKDSEKSTVSLRNVLEKAGDIALSGCTKDIEIKLQKENNVFIHGNESSLVEVFMNLIINATEVLNTGGVIEISWEKAKLDRSLLWSFPDAVDGPYVQINVKDNGPGIPNDLKNRIFEPFFTTKKGKKNGGLGLAIVYRLIRSHNGFIEVETDPGTTFSVYLPVL